MPYFDEEAIYKEARRRWVAYEKRPPVTGEMYDFPHFMAEAAWEAALAAQQNSPSADTFEQPFKEGAGVSEDTPTSALGGLSEEEVAEMALHIEREKCRALGNDCRAPDCYCTNIPSSEFVITFAHAIEAALRSASRRTGEK